MTASTEAKLKYTRTAGERVRMFLSRVQPPLSDTIIRLERLKEVNKWRAIFGLPLST
jgi:hypothetical protein